MTTITLSDLLAALKFPEHPMTDVLNGIVADIHVKNSDMAERITNRLETDENFLKMVTVVLTLAPCCVLASALTREEVVIEALGDLSEDKDLAEITSRLIEKCGYWLFDFAQANGVSDSVYRERTTALLEN